MMTNTYTHAQTHTHTHTHTQKGCNPDPVNCRKVTISDVYLLYGS